ncbi:MAG: hypothetical protein JSU63_05585 [Phycisphaerales bacterium]|nr:MAG: hypothetical protein JSU63_05585 [Phycisphaerales bacterium]
MQIQILMTTFCLLGGGALGQVDSVDARESDGMITRAEVEPPIVPPIWEHSIRKNRYISLCGVDPQPVAYQIEMTAGPGATGVLGWIGPADANGVARVVRTPFFSDAWPCPLHLGDCEIVPDAVYEVRATADGETFSIPLELGTVPRPEPWYYGDVVGPVDPDTMTFAPPNGIVNIDDITAYLFTSYGPPKPMVHTTWVDLHGIGDGSPPNYILNISDLQRILFGHQGQQYTDAPDQLAPADCSAHPWIQRYGDSGCLIGTQRGADDLDYPCVNEDHFEFSAGVGTLDIMHYSATYNCCPDDIRVTLSVEGNHLALTEEEILDSGGCSCICCFDVDTTLVDLQPGQYTYEYCWLDYEFGQQRCQTGEIEIPETVPHVETYGNGECLPGTQRGTEGTEYPCPDDDYLELTPGVGTLDITHYNATYNCCPDDILVALSVDDHHLMLTEEEILDSGGCFCICCFNVEATIVDLEPGLYTYEYCWWDYETEQQRCQPGEIEIPESLAHLENYGNSGCLSSAGRGTKDSVYPFCDNEQFELNIDVGTLHIVHRDATYNCCPDDILVTLDIVGNHLALREEEILTMPCDCMCCFDVEATVIDLEPGEYTLEYCWLDYETGQEQCYTDTVMIPATSANMGGYENSGCLSQNPPGGRDDVYPYCGDDQMALTLNGNTLNILHENATYNCCPDDIVVSLVVDGMILRLTEDEILTFPCFCLCCYNVESSVVDLTPGIYTVEYCWYDEETQQDVCHSEVIEVP